MMNRTCCLPLGVSIVRRRRIVDLFVTIFLPFDCLNSSFDENNNDRLCRQTQRKVLVKVDASRHPGVRYSELAGPDSLPEPERYGMVGEKRMLPPIIRITEGILLT